MSTANEIKPTQDVLPDTDPTRLARKRRRKTQTSGAIEDCFACQKRQTTCDRRRPYCSQCLEIGKECSGYKTVLTWGVGVASRGKLRGMSLPVPIPVAKPSAAASEAARRRTSFNAPRDTTDAAKGSAQARSNRKRTASIKSEVSEKPYRFQLNPQPPRTIPEETSQATNQSSWQLPSFRDLVFEDNSNPRNHFPSFMPPPMQIPDFSSSRSNSLEESPLSSSTTSLLSTTSLSSYSDTSDSHFAPSQISSDLNFSDAYSNLYNHPVYPTVPVSPRGSTMDQYKYQDALHNQNDYSNNLFAQQINDSSHTTAYGSQSENLMHMDVENDWPIILEQPHLQNLGENLDFQEIKADPADDVDLLDDKQDLVSMSSTMPGPTYAMSLYHVAPRMHYLLDYYDKVICPVLVAFDSPSNPYRMYMMQLASQNAGLQNAIAALVTNNMRMRNAKAPLRITNDATSWNPENGEEVSATVDRPSPEEQHYRIQSIEHLNAQLTNPIKARDDSVLATLLILCLFHICDSGVSKFKTQLAGVQKLLRMRGQVFHSEFVGWVEMFFAWLDVMTSAVNDREIQIHGDSLDLMNLSANLGALEQYSGVDGRLFKLIARLSRLNLLSQSRPVRDTSDMTPRASPQMKKAEQQSPIISYDNPPPQDSPTSLPQNSPNMSEYSDFPLADPDSRGIFWQEWRDLRQRLKDWEGYYNYYSPVTNSFSHDLPSPQRDLHHISESFRYSALLYTERLAFPNLPSSSPNFQELVAQALFHCAEIPANSCVLKFMLWPMFIIGTECVEEAQRELIRKRCVLIQEESGFYNNMNGLRVLERVWREHDEGTQVRPGCRGQAFRWRNAMSCVDGEYIVI